MSIVIMILVTHYINKKTKYLTKHLKDRSIEDDSEKRNIITLIQTQLKKNSMILKDTYLTLMLVAIRKQHIFLTGPDVIPSVPQVAENMKQIRFRAFEMTYADQ